MHLMVYGWARICAGDFYLVRECFLVLLLDVFPSRPPAFLGHLNYVPFENL